MSESLFPPDEPQRRPIEETRAMSMEERGHLIGELCRTTALVVRGREKMGLPPFEEEPLPESTWKFLREAAAKWRGDA